MQMTANTDDLLRQILEYKKEVQRKLTEAVCRFSYRVTMAAVGFTPIGDAIQNASSYEARQLLLGLTPIEGLARGGWQIQLDGTLSFREDYGQDAGYNAALDAYDYMQANFTLGETVTFGNTGPYILALEKNWSKQTQGQGILQPTMEELHFIYATDFKRLYEEA